MRSASVADDQHNAPRALTAAPGVRGQHAASHGENFCAGKPSGRSRNVADARLATPTRSWGKRSTLARDASRSRSTDKSHRQTASLLPVQLQQCVRSWVLTPPGREASHFANSPRHKCEKDFGRSRRGGLTPAARARAALSVRREPHVAARFTARRPGSPRHELERTEELMLSGQAAGGQACGISVSPKASSRSS